MIFRRRMLQLSLLLLIVLFSACKQMVANPVASRSQVLAFGEARVTLYLETKGRSNASLNFRLISAELADVDVWHALDIDKIRISREAAQDRQSLLGVAAVPVGTYTQVRLTFAEVERDGEKLIGEGLERQLQLRLFSPLVLAPGASSCLFVEWDLEAAPLFSGDAFASFAKFNVRAQALTQVADLVTVVCRDLDTVYQISPDQNRVVAALGLPDGVGEVAFSWNHRLFYAVSTKERLLLKYDAVTKRLLDSIALPLSVAPMALVLSDDGRYAYLSDIPANRIVKVDLERGFVVADTLKFLRPGRLFFLSTLNRKLLAVLAPRESAVYLLNAETLEPLFTLPVNGQPAGLALAQDYLYVSDYSSDKVAVYTLSNGRPLSLIRVGRKPLDLVTLNNRVYVSVSGASYLSLLMPPQVTPIRRIPSQFNPQALAISKNWQKIYVANRNPSQIEVLDLQSGTSLNRIPLAARPDQIILWEAAQ